MKHTRIPNARAKLAASLPSTTDILRGSLLHRTIRHRTGGAVCAKGQGHPVWVLTVTYPGGRTKQFSLSAEQKPLVQPWLRNYRKLKDTLERICELNLQLLRPEKNAGAASPLPHSASPISNCAAKASTSTLCCRPASLSGTTMPRWSSKCARIWGAG